MRVPMINGSPHAKGNTYTALHDIKKYSRKTKWKQKFCTFEIRREEAALPAIPVPKTADVFLMI